MGTKDHQLTIKKYIDDNYHTNQELAKAIHAHPEVSNHEYYSSDLLSGQLTSYGFHVEKNVAGHPTAFDARYKASKPGATIVLLAEYDALPGIGHACGHNLYGNYSILAAAALKQVIDDIGGEIRVYGTPGEEGGENGSAKGSFVKYGYFDDVDAALSTHPGVKYRPTARLKAVKPVDIVFHGKSAHAAGNPEDGRSALEALIQTYNGINALRLYLPEDVNIHGVITNGGEAPNVIPDYASARFYLRANSKFTAQDVYDKVEKVVAGAALTTGTTYEFGLFQNAVDDMVLTPLFEEVYAAHYKDLHIPESEIETTSMSSGSSDVGNVSHVVPTIEPYTLISDVDIPGHSEAFKAAALSERGMNSIPIAAKLLALTALDLYEDEQLLERIKAQHAENLRLQEKH